MKCLRNMNGLNRDKSQNIDSDSEVIVWLEQK